MCFFANLKSLSLKRRPIQLVLYFKIAYKLYLTKIRFRKSKTLIYSARESHFERSKTQKSDDAWPHRCIPYMVALLRDCMMIWTLKYRKSQNVFFCKSKKSQYETPFKLASILF